MKIQEIKQRVYKINKQLIDKGFNTTQIQSFWSECLGRMLQGATLQTKTLHLGKMDKKTKQAGLKIKEYKEKVLNNHELISEKYKEIKSIWSVAKDMTHCAIRTDKHVKEIEALNSDIKKLKSSIKRSETEIKKQELIIKYSNI